MTPTTDTPAQLVRRFHDAVHGFHELLERESAQLALWPLPDLWPLHDDKLRQVRELELCQQALDTLARQAGAGQQGLNPRTAIASLLDPVALRYWEDGLSLLAGCQQLNAGHGQVLSRQQEATRQSLELLRGGLDQGMTYGRQGHRLHAGRHLSLGRA